MVAVGLVGCRTGAGSAPRSAPTVAGAAAVQLSAGDVGVFTADGEAAYWSEDRQLWRRGLGAVAAPIARLPGEARLLVAHRAILYAVTDDGVYTTATTGGVVTPLAPGVTGGAVAVDDDGLWIADDQRVRLIPRAGGPARLVIGELRQIAAIATDADALYVAAITEHDAVAGSDGVAPHAIWRIAKQGGARTLVADVQYGVRGLAVRARRLVWGTEDRGGVESAPVTGGPPRLALPAGVDGFAADARGAVVRTRSGILVEVGAGQPRLFNMHDGWRPAPVQPIALAGDSVVVMLEDPATGGRALWRLARPDDRAATVAAWSRLAVRGLAATEGHVYMLDAARVAVEGWSARVVRLRPEGGSQRVAAAPQIDGFAARGDAVAYLAEGAIYLATLGAAPRRLTAAADAIGLTVGAAAVFWIEGGAVRTVPRTGGVASGFHQPDWGSAGSGTPFAELVVDGTSVFYSSLGFGASAVFHTRGGAEARALYEATDEGLGDSLTAIGGALFVVVGPSGVARVPMNGSAPSVVLAASDGLVLDRLVADDRRLYALATRADELVHVLAIDPAAPPGRRVTTLARLPLTEQTAWIAATGGAVYLGLAEDGWVVRIAGR